MFVLAIVRFGYLRKGKWTGTSRVKHLLPRILIWLTGRTRSRVNTTNKRRIYVIPVFQIIQIVYTGVIDPARSRARRPSKIPVFIKAKSNVKTIAAPNNAGCVANPFLTRKYETRSTATRPARPIKSSPWKDSVFGGPWTKPPPRRSKPAPVKTEGFTAKPRAHPSDANTIPGVWYDKIVSVLLSKLNLLKRKTCEFKLKLINENHKLSIGYCRGLIYTTI